MNINLTLYNINLSIDFTIEIRQHKSSQANIEERPKISFQIKKVRRIIQILFSETMNKYLIKTIHSVNYRSGHQ